MDARAVVFQAIADFKTVRDEAKKTAASIDDITAAEARLGAENAAQTRTAATQRAENERGVTSNAKLADALSKVAAAQKKGSDAKRDAVNASRTLEQAEIAHANAIKAEEAATMRAASAVHAYNRAKVDAASAAAKFGADSERAKNAALKEADAFQRAEHASRSFDNASRAVASTMNDLRKAVEGGARELERFARGGGGGGGIFSRLVSGAEEAGGAIGRFAGKTVLGAISGHGFIAMLAVAAPALFAFAAALSPVLQGLAVLPQAFTIAAQAGGSLFAAFGGVKGALSAGFSAFQSNGALNQTPQAAATRSLQQMTNQHAVIQAEQGITEAQYAATQAQRQLTLARMEAARQLVDLKNAVIDAELAERGASLTLEQAKQNLAAAMSNPGATKLQIEEAKLAVEQAQQGVKEAHEKTKRAVQDNNRAQKLGISGNQQVVDAMHSVRQAVLGLANAQYQLVVAQKQMAISNMSVTSQLTAFQMAMRQISPAGRAFVNQILDMRKAWNQVSSDVQTKTLPGFTYFFRQLTSLFPAFDKILGNTGSLFSNFMHRLGTAIVSPAWRSSLDSLGKANNDAIKHMLDALFNLIDYFRKVAVAAEPLMAFFTHGFDAWTKRLDKAASDGHLEKMFGKGGPVQTAFTDLGKILGGVWNIFKALAHDARGAGQGMVNGLVEWLNGVADWINKHPEEVKKFFHDFAKALGEFLKVSGGLIVFLAQVAASPLSPLHLLGDVLNIVADGLTALGNAMKAVGLTAFGNWVSHMSGALPTLVAGLLSFAGALKLINLGRGLVGLEAMTGSNVVNWISRGRFGKPTAAKAARQSAQEATMLWNAETNAFETPGRRGGGRIRNWIRNRMGSRNEGGFLNLGGGGGVSTLEREGGGLSRLGRFGGMLSRVGRVGGVLGTLGLIAAPAITDLIGGGPDKKLTAALSRAQAQLASVEANPNATAAQIARARRNAQLAQQRLNDSNQTGRHAVANVASGVFQGAAFGMMFGPMGALVGALAGGLWAVFTKTKLGKILEDWWKKDAWPFFKKLPAEIGGFFKEVGHYIAVPFTAAYHWMTGTFIPWITGVFSSIWSWVSGWFSSYWNLLYDLYVKIPMKVFHWFTGTFLPGVEGVFTTLWSWVTGWVKGTWNGIYDIFISPVKKAWHWLTGTAFPAIGNAFSDFGNGVSTVFSKIWDGLKDIFMSPIRWVAHNVLRPLLSGVEWILKGVGAGGFAKDIDKGMSALHFARGNWVPGEGNRDSVPAMLTPGEFVIRKDAARTIAREHPGLLENLNYADRRKYGFGSWVGNIWDDTGGALLSGAGNALGSVKNGLVDIGDTALKGAGAALGFLKKLMAKGALFAFEHGPMALARMAINGLTGAHPTTWPKVIAHQSVMGPMNAIDHFIRNWAGDGKGGKGAGGKSVPYSGGGAAQWRGTVVKALKMLGLAASAGNVNDVLTIIEKESGGNPNAINLNDRNARMGDPSRGLMQTIMSTFLRWAGPLANRGIYDPLANIYAGINYAVHTYGSLNNVPGIASLASGGGYRPYNLGGYVPPLHLNSGGYAAAGQYSGGSNDYSRSATFGDIVINNPRAERASDSLPRMLRQASKVGVFS